MLDGGANPPGYWAADKLREENASWRVTIPACLAPGSYVLRHEIIALHGAFEQGKAQNYPQCVNLRVMGGGGGGGVGMLEGGVEGIGLYRDTDPGILVGIYNSLPGYVVPGPKIWSCGGGDGGGMGMGSGMNGTGVGGNNTSTSGSSIWTTRRRRMMRSG